jgi:hypothetical protein
VILSPLDRSRITPESLGVSDATLRTERSHWWVGCNSYDRSYIIVWWSISYLRIEQESNLVISSSISVFDININTRNTANGDQRTATWTWLSLCIYASNAILDQSYTTNSDVSK